MKSKQSTTFDIYEFDIRPLEHLSFPYVSKYLQRLPKATGQERLVVLRCISTLMGDLHRLLTSNNSSMSSVGVIKKRFHTHNAPTTLQTQQMPVDTVERDEDLDEANDERLDFMSWESFEMFFLQVITTMNGVHTFMSDSEDKDDDDKSMDTDDDLDQVIDSDQSRDLASRAFCYALDSFYFLLSLFKVKQTHWQKEMEKDSTCLNRLIKLLLNTLITSKKGNAKDASENERVQIFRKLSSFTNILNLIDSTRLCQSLEQFVQLFEEETEQVKKEHFSVRQWKRMRISISGRTLQNLHLEMSSTVGRMQSGCWLQHSCLEFENHARASRGEPSQSLLAPSGIE